MTESLNQVYDAIIIGGGPAGTTAAIYAARASLKVGILDKGLTTGALGTTSKIANYPGLEGEVDGAELLQTMPTARQHESKAPAGTKIFYITTCKKDRPTV